MVEQRTLRVTGWPAVVVGLAIVGWAMWGVAKHVRPVPAPAKDALQAWLVTAYSTPEEAAQVSVDRVEGHGWEDFLVVRTALTAHHGDTAPHAAVRYLDVARQRDGSWRVTRETDAWNYWWVLVPAPRSGST